MHRMAVLKQMVNRLAKLYGHDLNPWIDNENLSKDSAKCKTCGKLVFIEIYGIGISEHKIYGDVMLPCKGIRGSMVYS